MYELEDERPIPLGRAATPTAASAAHAEAPSVVEPAVEAQPVVPVSGVKTGPPPAVAAAPEVVPPTTPVMPVPVVNPEAQPTDPPAQPDGHPLAGLRDFRLEPILVEPAFDWRRDVGRFLVHYALVMALVYSLVIAFVLLLAHVRGTPA